MELSLLNFAQLIVSIWEIVICYMITLAAVADGEHINVRTGIFAGISGIVLGVLLSYNRNFLFFSYNMFFFVILVSSLTVWLAKRREFTLIVSITAACYAVITSLEFFLAFLCMSIIKFRFDRMVYFHALSYQKEAIYFIACGIASAMAYVLMMRIKKGDVSVRRYRNVLLLFDIILTAPLLQYQSVMDEMSSGEQKMKAVPAALSLLLVVIIIIFLVFLFLIIQTLREENKMLLMREELAREHYDELSRSTENNRKYMHDMKNHLLVLQEYGKQGDCESIVNYIEKMKLDFLAAENRMWTGNRVLDFILNQKRGTANQNGIALDIHTTSLSKICLNENEICTVFGNLLDNALEACMQIKGGPKWITVKMEQRDHIFNTEIQNSYDTEPTIKNGELVTNKKNKVTHGYGIKNVRRIVDKHDGVISYQKEDKVFSVRMSFFDI